MPKNLKPSFAELLAAEVKDRGYLDGEAWVVDLKKAVELLFWNGKSVNTSRRASYERQIRMATGGQPFRLDTRKGPIFLPRHLWRFAGRSGPFFSGRRRRNPDWVAA